MADKILRIMQFEAKHGLPFGLIKTVLQKKTKNVNMKNLEHELLKHDLQVSELHRLQAAILVLKDYFLCV